LEKEETTEIRRLDLVLRKKGRRSEKDKKAEKREGLRESKEGECKEKRKNRRKGVIAKRGKEGLKG